MVKKLITKIHRKYPDHKWDFKALSMRIEDEGKLKDIIYGKLKSNNKKSIGVEVYSGRNYIVGSNERSHSKNYPLSKVPKKYKNIVKELMQKHQKTKWSKKNRVDLN